MDRVRENTYFTREVNCSICGVINVGWNAYHTSFVEAVERHSYHHVFMGEGHPEFIRSSEPVIGSDQTSQHSGPDPRLATV
jgi:hypothetical protein